MSTEADTSQRIAWEDPNAVQRHVVLEDIEPPIWRRLVVPLETTLVQLHRILQSVIP